MTGGSHEVLTVLSVITADARDCAGRQETLANHIRLCGTPVSDTPKVHLGSVP